MITSVANRHDTSEAKIVIVIAKWKKSPQSGLLQRSVIPGVIGGDGNWVSYCGMWFLCLKKKICHCAFSFANNSKFGLEGPLLSVV